jgi:hypothetical protein
MRSVNQSYGKHRARPDVRPSLYSFDQVVRTLGRVTQRGNTTETESSIARELRAILPKPAGTVPDGPWDTPDCLSLTKKAGIL